MPGLYSLIGDSNLRRHMNPQNCRDLPHMTGAQVKTCSNLDTLAQVLRTVRNESTICILACLTNFLTQANGASASAGLKVQPIIAEFKEVVLDYCSEFPERFVLSVFVLLERLFCFFL